ncbi:52 kDa repressor of the inhibitor of the protein kinase-like [Hydra vulgaris]|uniref:52 kDa repressor of the inhibitor of the protein kinase-like n=1 Tax=Hydra vulgaris TaxID=6087 RepID=UPI001F5EB4E5|nr:52 kDa repressor of the inhibitor of the protein kinase-like [Hydra vulgaris]
MPSFCAAINCGNKSGKSCKDISFFRFPKDEKRCKQWVINCRRKDLDKKDFVLLNKNFYLCSNHFENTMYYSTNNNGKRLLQSAVPTIFNIPNPPPLLGCKRKPPVEHYSVPTKKQVVCLPVNSDNNLENKMSINKINFNKLQRLLLTLRVKSSRLRKQVQHLKSKQKPQKNCDGSIKHILNLSRKFLTPIQVSFFKSQLEMSKRVNKGKRWAVSDKVLALRILFYSPQTFNVLQTIFCLPSQTCLLLFLSRVFSDLQEGFST